MNLQEKCSVLYFHKLCLEESGEGTTGALGWVEKGNQLSRFEILSNIADLNGASILDVGCGYGHLKKYLDDRYYNISYTGIDFMPEFIAFAAKTYENIPNTTFIRKDFSEGDLPYADYIFASGVFCYRSADENYYNNLITRMYNSCRKGIGFNMLNIDKFPPTGFLKAHGVKGIEAFCRKLSNNVVVKMDYLPDDFTIFMYKQG